MRMSNTMRSSAAAFQKHWTDFRPGIWTIHSTFLSQPCFALLDLFILAPLVSFHTFHTSTLCTYILSVFIQSCTALIEQISRNCICNLQ